MNFVESWVAVDGFPKYEVSDLGRVRNVRTNRILQPCNNGNGYWYVGLWNEAGRQNCYLHRLVGFMFLGLDQYEEPNHLDGDKSNNAAYNLDPGTRAQNIQHAYRTGLMRPSQRRNVRPVRINETEEVFESAAACARAIGGRQSTIHRIVNGIGRRHMGYTFSYAD